MCMVKNDVEEKTKKNEKEVTDKIINCEELYRRLLTSASYEFQREKHLVGFSIKREITNTNTLKVNFSFYFALLSNALRYQMRSHWFY